MLQKNRIAQVVQAGKIQFLEEEITRLEELDVLVKIHASLICGSDLHIFKDCHPAVELPVTLGHEFTGEVIAVGEKVMRFEVGDRVVAEPVIACGKCEACKRGQYGYCENISFTYRCGHGAMADYFVGTEERLYKLPQGMSYEKGALTEPLAVAVHAVKRAEIKLGDRVVITGAGAIGIMIAAVCKRLGARLIVISDFSVRRLEMAKRMGADITVNAAEEDLVSIIHHYSDGSGFEKAFECVGNEHTFQQLLSCAKINGVITDVGIFENPEINLV